MPRGRYVSAFIYANGKKLPEYKIKDQFYTEVDLHGPRSYFIEDGGQKYPAVPFSIEMNRLCQDCVWIKIGVDGQQICSRPLQHYFMCDAVKAGNELRELVFSIPRILEEQEKANPLGEYASTVKLVVYKARQGQEQMIPIFDKVKSSSNAGQEPNVLVHLTKKDVQHSIHTSQSGSVVSREGRTMQLLYKSGRFRHASRITICNEVLEEVVINIRPVLSSSPLHAPSFLKDVGETGVAREGQAGRRPLGDVKNNLGSQAPRHSRWDQVSRGPAGGKATGKGNATGAAGEENRTGNANSSSGLVLIPPERIKKRISCFMGSGNENGNENVPAETTHSMHTANDGQGTNSLQSGLIPLERIKKRQSMSQSAAPASPVLEHPQPKIKTRLSCLIPQEHIVAPVAEVSFEEGEIRDGQDENEATFRQAARLIPPEKIKTRLSCLIPPEHIKRRESCIAPLAEVSFEEGEIRDGEDENAQAPQLIPSEKIKTRLSCLIPPEHIKRRESCMAPLAEESGEELVTRGSGEKLRIEGHEESYIVIDDTDEEDGREDLVYECKDDDDSLICLGDDECHIMDISQNFSMVEIEDDDDDDEDDDEAALEKMDQGMTDLSLEIDEDELLSF